MKIPNEFHTVIYYYIDLHCLYLLLLRPACGPGDSNTFPHYTTKDPRNASLENQKGLGRGYVGGTGSNASMTFPFAGLHTSQKAKAGPDSCIACGAGNMVIQFIH